jgi:hypothetical protein
MSESDIRAKRNQISQNTYRIKDLRLDLKSAEDDLHYTRHSEHGDDEELMANLESDVQAIESDIFDLDQWNDRLAQEIEDLEHEEQFND